MEIRNVLVYILETFGKSFLELRARVSKEKTFNIWEDAYERRVVDRLSKSDGKMLSVVKNIWLSCLQKIPNLGMPHLICSRSGDVLMQWMEPNFFICLNRNAKDLRIYMSEMGEESTVDAGDSEKIILELNVHLKINGDNKCFATER
jgi:hypothetical protein